MALEDPFGILVVDKEKGVTSHDVVAMVRRKFNIKKVGHAGTLDPNATGVLILLLGKATKLSNSFINDDKKYEAVMKLGVRTDSGDSEGKVIAEKEPSVSEEKIKEVVFAFKGEIEQIPPMVSAKKIGGKKLYKLARLGKVVERQPQKIVIKEIEVIKIEGPYVTFRVVCSKGTYIRQLADDMGEKLGCGAHLSELRRIASGAYDVSAAISSETIKTMDQDTFNESITRI